MQSGSVWQITAIVAALAASVPSARAQAQAAAESRGYVSPWKTPWDYQGPRGSTHWSELDPAYAACAGKEQSPIDIRNTERAALPALRFDYHAGPIHYVINNGHTIRVNYNDPVSGDFFVFDGVRYRLTQFHFHRPSEERVNGKPYDMVLHLMHESSDGKAVGVAVFLNAGKDNPVVQELWDHMPLSEGQNFVGALRLNPADLLPRDIAAYYMYRGSVTAPPCTEGVTWFVLKQPVTLSPAQIAAFAKLYPDDVRPPQPRNGRIVKSTG